MVEQIEQYGQFHRHEAAYSRGEADDRMVDTLALAHEQWLSEASGSEVAAFYEGISAGLAPDCPAAVELEPNDEPLDALFKKGKGKGKGKRSGKGGPASSGGQGANYGGGQGGGKAGDGRARRPELATTARSRVTSSVTAARGLQASQPRPGQRGHLSKASSSSTSSTTRAGSRQRTGASGLWIDLAASSTSSLTPTSSNRASGSQRYSARRRHRPQRLRQRGPRPRSQGLFSSRRTSQTSQNLRLTLGYRHRLTLGPGRPQCSPQPPRLSLTASPR